MLKQFNLESRGSRVVVVVVEELGGWVKLVVIQDMGNGK